MQGKGLGTKNFTEHLTDCIFVLLTPLIPLIAPKFSISKVSQKWEIVSFQCGHIIYTDNIRATALSLGVVLLLIEHIVVTLYCMKYWGHCPDHRFFLFSIEHIVPLSY